MVVITPAGVLLGLVTETEQERLSMLSDDYVKALDGRASEIKINCGTQYTVFKL